MKIRGQIISLDPDPKEGAGIVLDAQAGKTYAFFFAEVEGCDPRHYERCGLKTGRMVTGDAGRGGVLTSVHIETDPRSRVASHSASRARGR